MPLQNQQAANKAWQESLDTYLSYRCEGGENNGAERHMTHEVHQAIKKGSTTAIKHVIEQYFHENNLSYSDKRFLYKLQAIIAGERSLAFVEDENLYYRDAAELILLLKTLEN